MTSLAKYHGRSPRYILDTEDESLVRVAGPKQTPWEESTSIKNISLTGLAFTAPIDLCPLLGEVIKIQFTPPGSRQMASYAIVTRLDEVSSENMLVGIHFYKMDMQQRIALAQGLAKRFKELQDRGAIDSLFAGKSEKRISFTKLAQKTLLGLLALVWCIGFYAIIKFDFGSIYKLLLSKF